MLNCNKENKITNFQKFLFQQKQIIFLETEKLKKITPPENFLNKKTINQIENEIKKIEEYFFDLFYQELINEPTTATTNSNEKNLTQFLKEKDKK